MTKRNVLVAVLGIGGFHLLVDARNAQALRRLREGKPRREKPFALMIRDLEQAHELCGDEKAGHPLDGASHEGVEGEDRELDQRGCSVGEEEDDLLDESNMTGAAT